MHILLWIRVARCISSTAATPILGDTQSLLDRNSQWSVISILLLYRSLFALRKAWCTRTADSASKSKFFVSWKITDENSKDGIIPGWSRPVRLIRSATTATPAIRGKGKYSQFSRSISNGQKKGWLRGCWNRLYYRPNTHISYFSIFFAFFIQNKKSFSRIRKKM